MFKFVRGHMESIDGVMIYPLISLLIFFIFFVVLFLWVITAKKKDIDEVSKLPLDNNPENQEL